MIMQDWHTFWNAITFFEASISQACLVSGRWWGRETTRRGVNWIILEKFGLDLADDETACGGLRERFFEGDRMGARGLEESPEE